MSPRQMIESRLAVLTVVAAALVFARVTHESAPAAEPAARETIVYVTKTGSKYHRDGCQHLRQSKIPRPLSQAASMYGPCSRCRPPTP
jgi:hypothetical protein